MLIKGGAWQERGSGVFEGGIDTPMGTMNIEIYSRYNEGKSVVAERFIKTLNTITQFIELLK